MKTLKLTFDYFPATPNILSAVRLAMLWLIFSWSIACSPVSYSSQIDDYSFTLLEDFEGVWWSKIIFSENKFIAVGGKFTGAKDNGRLLSQPFIAYSPDGEQWTKSNIALKSSDELLNDIAYGGGVYVTVGQNGTVLSSGDGINWRSEESGISHPDRPMAVTFGNGMFIFSGARFSDRNKSFSLVYGSKNGGGNWDRIHLPYNRTWLYSVDFMNGKFFIGVRGFHLVSSDTINWAVGPVSPRIASETWTMNNNDYAFGNNVYVSVGRIGSYKKDNPPPVHYAAMVSTSEDGIQWTRSTLTGIDHGLDSVKYINSEFIAVGGGIVTSPNGVTWSQPRNTTNYTEKLFAYGSIADIAYGSGRYVLLGQRGNMLVSNKVSPTLLSDANDAQKILSEIDTGASYQTETAKVEPGASTENIGTSNADLDTAPNSRHQGAFAIDSIHPEWLIGANCRRPLKLSGEGFFNNMAIHWHQISSGNKGKLKPDQLRIIDPQSAEIKINTADELSTWEIFAELPDQIRTGAITFEVIPKANKLTPKSLGDKIGSYNNIAARSNGKCTNGCYKNYEIEAPYQCVEYVKRYYLSRGLVNLDVTWESAQQFWDRGEFTTLEKRKNTESSEMPKPEDLIFFQAGTYGHVAMITKINSNSIEIIQQNLDRDTAYATLPMSIDNLGIVTIHPDMQLEYVDNSGVRHNSGCKYLSVLGWLSRKID